MKLTNVSFQIKAVLPTAITTLIFSITLGIGISSYIKQAQISRQNTELIQPVVYELQDAYKDYYQVLTALQGYELSKGDEALMAYHRAEFYDNAPKIEPRIRTVEALTEQGIIDSQFDDTLNQLVSDSRAWVTTIENIITTDDFSQAQRQYENLASDIDLGFRDIRENFSNIQDAVDDRFNQATSTQLEQIAATRWVLVLGGLIALATALVSSVLFSRMLAKPVLRLRDALKDITSGTSDLTVQLPVVSNDELGQIAKYFNRFVTKIHQTMDHVVHAAASVATQTDELLTATQTVSAKALTQQSDSASVATAVEELNSTSATMAEHASQAARVSHSTAQATGEGDQLLDRTVQAMNGLGDSIQGAAKVVHLLEQDVENISSIVDVIRGIADQTNLLALNAAIEAARAGDQGRGFAVVADEVRSLASKTQDSTGEIQEMIERLQSGSQQAVTAMTSSQNSSRDTIEQMQSVRSALNEVTRAIEEINQLNEQIAHGTSEQSEVSAELAERIQSIATASEETASVVADAESSFTDLQATSHRLNQAASEFIV